MAWIYDTYDVMHPGRNNLPVVTGKPLDIGGSAGRHEATARGCLFATREALARGLVPGLEELAGARVAVQGYGNAGAIAARLFHEQGAVIIAASDSRGGIRSSGGLDPLEVARHKEKTGSVVGFPGAENISNEELLTIACDILIPAALEHQIHRQNAPAIQARLISEAANGPVTPGADSILFKRGIVVLPDILANAGGVTVSYYEWVQNAKNEQWEEDEVNGKLERKMVQATGEVIDKAAQVNSSLERLTETWRERNREKGMPVPELTPVDLRTAALVLAIDRVARVVLERGIWP
jgi:glutamate dehydrogenase (NAD(P)+)